MKLRRGRLEQKAGKLPATERTAWFEEVSGKYRSQMTVPNGATRQDQTVLTAHVSGNFPGSPFPFDYHLTIHNGKITALKIPPSLACRWTQTRCPHKAQKGFPNFAPPRLRVNRMSGFRFFAA